MHEPARTLEENYRQVLEGIDRAALKAGRDPQEVTLVVVTKGHPVDTVRALIQAGVSHAGENRVEEGIPKRLALTSEVGVKWHMIGHVQSRKARQVCEHFNFLHSLDRVKLARRLDRFAGELDRRLPVLLQFNVSGEATKSGWEAADESDWPALLPDVETILGLSNLQVKGLMTLAPYSANPESARPVFIRLRKMREFFAQHFPAGDWDELSMGMSADFEVGIEEGATMVRIGTAILGSRSYPG